MWELYQKSVTFHLKPSSEFGVQNSWVAWQFDNAVFTFGRFVDAKLDRAKSMTDKKRVLRELLGIKLQPQKISVKAMGQVQGYKID